MDGRTISSSMRGHTNVGYRTAFAGINGKPAMLYVPHILPLEAISEVAILSNLRAAIAQERLSALVYQHHYQV